MPALLAQGTAPAPAIGAAGRPQPQTTVQQGHAGPFIRFARAASRPGYTANGTVLAGGQLSQPLASAPGYLRWLDLTIQATGGTGTAAVLSADGPFNVASIIQMKDPWGTPLITGDGYSILKLLNVYSGQGLCPLYPANTASQLPSWSATTTAGNFTFKAILPVEGTKGYGVFSIGNASVMPSLLMTYGTQVFSTQPTGAPTLTTVVDEFYYDVDPSNPVEPPGNGSTFQTAVVQGSQTIGSAGSNRVQLPRTGGYLTSLILVLRDNTAARVDAWNASGRIRVYIDGVARYDETYNQAQDRMNAMTNGTPRDAGVMAYSFKLSASQMNLGYFDTLEQALQTNPGTLIEVEMTPWGTISNAPGTLYAIITQLVPSGPIAQGLPEA